MVTVDRASEQGLREIGEFREAHQTWPRGERPAAIREAATEFRGRFLEEGQVRAVRTVDLVSAAYPASFASVHATQWAWYVPGGMDGVRTDNLVLVDGDVQLGKGLALLWTPGHTDGNHSLCVNTPEGIWVSSENGVAADNWHPHLSKIPGVRKWAEFYRREVVMN